MSRVCAYIQLIGLQRIVNSYDHREGPRQTQCVTIQTKTQECEKETHEDEGNGWGLAGCWKGWSDKSHQNSLCTCMKLTKKNIIDVTKIYRIRVTFT